MSGKECFEILDKIFLPKKMENIENIKGYTMKYGHIVENLKEYDGFEVPESAIVDEVLVSYFKEPMSYTTENMCEINTHGGNIVVKKILELCLKNGAEMAEPGEFTKRAFLNGRIDLLQAESVIDIIDAKSERELKAGMNQLEGRVSKEIHDIKQKIMDVMVNVEVDIDYPEYDVEEVTNTEINEMLDVVIADLSRLEKSFDNGKILKDGVKTAIIGKPNAGKSSLLNIMLNEERAIVSSQAGTTRDTIKEFVKIKGIPLKIIDTAGIRNTKDEIEAIGVKKAISLIDDADLVIAIFDESKDMDEEDERVINLIKNKKTIILLNKCDLSKKSKKTINYISKTNKTVIEASMRSKKGIDMLYNTIQKMFQVGEVEIGKDIIITNIRHKNQIHKAYESIEKAIDTVNMGMPIDIIAVEIKQTLENLGNITGDNVSEDIINEIFSKFCLGK